MIEGEIPSKISSLVDEKKIDWEIAKAVPDFTDVVYDMEANLGHLVKSLLWDYKMIVIRIRFFKLTYKGKLEKQFVNKLVKSISRIEGAINDLMALFEDEKIRQQVLKDIEDSNIISHMILKDQLLECPPEVIDELTIHIDDWFRLKNQEFEKENEVSKGE